MLALLYGIVCYVAFFVVFLYAIGFVSNVGVPHAIDSAPAGSWPVSLAIDLVLLTLFAVQHSVMARPAFKRRWTRIVPPVVERSTFVLAASAALALLFWQWRPLGGVVWDMTPPLLRMAAYAISAAGWLMVLASTLLIDHLHLFGLRQVWDYWRGAAPRTERFVTPGFYRYVRHPLYLGFLLAFWAAPTMTITHLVFAVATTGYILVAIQLEERDLTDTHAEYAAYRQRVPMLVPRPQAGRRTAASSGERATAVR
ncbi:MAG: methanethiol S-methyltransferase [Betaproteobacteria bacterium]